MVVAAAVEEEAAEPGMLHPQAGEVGGAAAAETKLLRLHQK